MAGCTGSPGRCRSRIAQEFGLLWCFHPFGDHGQAHGGAQAQHGADDGVAGPVHAEAGDEFEVDLEHVDG